MKEFKGTPGPWQMKKEKGEQEWFVFQKGSMKKFAGGSIRTPVADEIFNKYDAQLIAAAPELLEALQECLGWVNNGVARDVHNKAIAAIAKATGETK